MHTRSKMVTEIAERDAEFELDRTFRGPLLAFFLKRVRNRNEAEDLTQEVFVRLLHHPDRNNGRTIYGYVFTIAANLRVSSGLTNVSFSPCVARTGSAMVGSRAA